MWRKFNCNENLDKLGLVFNIQYSCDELGACV